VITIVHGRPAMACGHDAMVIQPDRFVEILMELS
jgi:hypothetical protein